MLTYVINIRFMRKGKEKTIKIRIYFSDTDALGIVYHANYLDFAERARTELLRDCGFDVKAFTNSNVFAVVRKAEIEYFSPGILEDLISVTAFVSHVGKTSMEVTHVMVCDKTQKPICTVKCVLVYVTKKDDVLTATPIPSEFSSAFFN